MGIITGIPFKDDGSGGATQNVGLTGCAAGRRAVLHLAYRNSVGAGTPTVNGNAMNILGSVQSGGSLDGEWFEYTLQAGDGATPTLSFTLGGAVRRGGTVWILDSVLSLGTPADSTTPTSPSTQDVASQLGSFVLCAGWLEDVVTVTTGPGQTQWQNENEGTDTYFSSSEPGATLVTMSCTYTGSTDAFQSCVNVQFVAAALTGGSQSRQPLRHQQRSRLVSEVAAALSISATAAITLDDVVTAATAQLKIAGTSGVTLGDVTPSATGVLPIQAASSVTLGDVTPASTGVLVIKASSSPTLDDVTLSATATISQPVIQVLGSQQPVVPWLNRSRLISNDVAPSNLINAQANITLGDVSCSAQGALVLKASSGITVADVTPSATGAVKIQAGASVTLDPVTVTASGVGTASSSGTLGVTLGDVTITAAGAVKVAASASISLGAVSISATGGLSLAGTSAVTLAAVTVFATATIADLVNPIPNGAVYARHVIVRIPAVIAMRVRQPHVVNLAVYPGVPDE